MARIAALLLCAAAGFAHAESSDQVQAPPSEWLGAPSCSARACHGSVGVGRHHPIVWGNEHTIWAEHDRHRLAYAALLAPRGQQIAERLGLGAAHQARECLGCHAPAALDSPANAPCVPSYVTEGIGCEACHGPAQRWIAAHTAADWNLLSPQEKQRDFGLRNTKDLAARAALCSECHVGSDKGDVNHDLIAAGHPRLTFEFASHLHRLPLHWDEKGENDRRLRPAFEARVWTIGQIAAAKAQLELLTARAEGTSPGAVWPEFAEYSCYGCHRSLKGEVPVPAGPLGQPVWGAWHFPLLPLVGHAPRNAELTDLRGAMQSLSADRTKASEHAREAAQQMHEWLVATAPADADLAHIRRQLALLIEQGPEKINGEWDTAAQLYLALSAWQQARLDVQQRVTDEDQAIRRLLGQARRDLQVPSTGPEQFIEQLRQHAQLP